jgi:hypothetical protein
MKFRPAIFWDVTPCCPTESHRNHRLLLLLLTGYLLGLIFQPEDAGSTFVPSEGELRPQGVTSQKILFFINMLYKTDLLTEQYTLLFRYIVYSPCTEAVLFHASPIRMRGILISSRIALSIFHMKNECYYWVTSNIGNLNANFSWG